MMFYGKTDVGKKRSANQDDFIIKSYPDCTVAAVVCDGMGGVNGGNIASALAVSAFIRTVDESPLCDLTEDEVTSLLLKAVDEANIAVYDKAGEDPSLLGMGTTLVGCIIRDDKLSAVNIGDSRLYVVRADGMIEQISHDHSYVQYLVDLGTMTKEEAKNSKNKNLITRAVGTERTVEGDTFSVDLCTGDSVFICSDGLSNLVEDEEIAKIVSDGAKNADLQSACEKLVSLANERGGSDNITSVILSV